MLFNSLQFAVFFIIVYILYLSLNHRWQNRMLLVASYIFYGAWDWRFLSLIWISTILDYICGIKIHDTGDIRRKKLFLFLSIFGNLSILGFFKYFDFFAANLQDLLGTFGITIQPHFLHIILPVGISFYTFQTMSYTIDIYRREMPPTRKFFDFALFVAFFPQLVAGPIERAKHLLPQILKPRKVTVNKFYDGSYLIFWGLFQKVFIADNLAKIVDPIFAAGAPYNGASVLIGVYAFAFQILCDFAGYSNIARGLGKCMGFDIMINFNLPYFATNPREFWKRWHISLSTWLKDYLYIPLGGNRKGPLRTYRNLAITMLLGGLWHGAAWTFIIWGAYHGVLLIIHRAIKPFLQSIPTPKGVFAAKLWFVLRVILFFHVICLGWLIFRTQSLAQLSGMLNSLLLNFHITPGLLTAFKDITYLIFFLVVVQILQYINNSSSVIAMLPRWGRKVFIVSLATLYVYNLIYGKFSPIDSGPDFIYFQF